MERNSIVYFKYYYLQVIYYRHISYSKRYYNLSLHQNLVKNTTYQVSWTELRTKLSKNQSELFINGMLIVHLKRK